MYLKSLVLQGFKSFPDKTTINFADGMTAIVGPNGSGKSNISDAIRWVLGEQSSRSLRGAKMEDVIFGGTQKRGPVGFAQVSLILDNHTGVFQSEYAEIMVARRYYRSGESEYFINKSRVRLKDINELFMDTGLGRDGYSMIGQGRIDEILSIKSEDRREVFEEAAGVTKFRYRKEEAERKLEQTEENLVRIRDIWKELTAQAGPLEQQAGKARQYLVLRDRLRGLELALWLQKLGGLKEETARAEEKQSIAESSLSDAKKERERLQASAEQRAGDLRQSEIELDGLRKRLSKTEEEASAASSEIAVIDEAVRGREGNIKQTEDQLSRQKEQKETLSAQIMARQRRLDELAEQQESAKGAIGALDGELAGLSESSASGIAEELRQKLSQAAQKAALFKAQSAAESDNLEQMDRRRGTIGEDVSEALSRLNQEEQAQAALQKEIEENAAAFEQCQNRMEGLTLKAEARRMRVQETEQRTYDTTARLTDCRGRIRMLSELQRDYEGFSRAVKLTMGRAAAGELQGIHGPVSSLISVEAEFITAIETVLGAAASNLVVDSAQDGKAAIQYLKKADGGRATFLPVDMIKPQQLKETGLEQEKGFLGVASKLVSCQERYRAIVENLLGRTVVVENLDCAIALAKHYQNRFRIVTRDGQLINAGGSMTGGSVSKSSGILSRQNQLKEQQEREKKLSQDVTALTQALEKAKRDFSALSYELATAREQQDACRQEGVRLQATAAQHQALLESVRARHSQLMAEQENLEKAKQDISQRLETAEKARKEAESDCARLEKELGEALKRSGEITVLRQGILEKLGAARTEHARMAAEHEAQQSALSELNALMRNMDAEAENSARRIEEYRTEIEKLFGQRAQAEKKRESYKGGCQDIRDLIDGVLQQRMRLEGEKTRADKRAQEQTELIVGLEREHARLEGNVLQLKGEEKQILDRMWESYELTPSGARECAPELRDKQQAEKDAAEIKNSMRALGNVNLDSIDEYAALSERLSFLTRQKEDLETSQKELFQVIGELTENMREIFGNEFAKLNRYFGETFKEIFGGGHAELRLEDSGDILNSGIEIRVVPPGKSLKTLTLLSGGERAFVAIALYFAILKVRPTPFCVLDEIEAALDDVNVDRFAKYIKRLTASSQFIVITHRRGTMEQADMLYGVTMQEQGISKLLMLNLAEAEKALNMKLE